MKRYNYILIGLLAANLFSACDDGDFLTEKPKNIYTIENAFEKSSQVDATLVRAYVAYRDMYGWGNMYLNNMLQPAKNLLGGMGSDCIDGTGQLATASGSMSNFMSLNANTTIFNTTWNALYALASDANLALYGSEQVQWSSEAEKTYAVAQARFFRGWSYLRLAECYGGVPIVEAYSDELKFDYQRSSREDTYKFAVADLEAAVNGLPDYPAQDGRVAKGAASHFLAEAYIALGTENGDKSNFAKAIAAAKVTIGLHPLMTERFGSRANPGDTGTSGINPLDPTKGVANYKADGDVFYDLFQIGNYNRSSGNTEALMVLQNPTYEQYSVSGGTDYLLGLTVLCPYRDISWKTQYRESGASSGPWTNNVPLAGNMSCAYLGGNTWGLVGCTDYSDEVVWNGVFATDMRNDQINRCDPVVLDSKHSMYGKVVKKEWLDEPSRLMRIPAKITMQDGWGWDNPHHIWNGQPYSYQWGRDWYACRSAETYLLLAEAELRNGNQAEAVAAINKVRARAKASFMYSGSISLKDILDERARELAWEEHRWPTLLRMDSSKGNNDVMKTQLKYTMYANDMAQKDAIIPTWTLFPIPTTVINLNSGAKMEQNKGWD